METFTDRFAALLVERNWTAEEAARHLPVSAVAIRGWMGAPGTRAVVDPKASHLLAICREFAVRPEWLMFGTLPRQDDMGWPFITTRERVDALPPVIKALLDRIVFDVVEIGGSAKIT